MHRAELCVSIYRYIDRKRWTDARVSSSQFNKAPLCPHSGSLFLRELPTTRVAARWSMEKKLFRLFVCWKEATNSCNGISFSLSLSRSWKRAPSAIHTFSDSKRRKLYINTFQGETEEIELQCVHRLSDALLVFAAKEFNGKFWNKEKFLLHFSADEIVELENKQKQSCIWCWIFLEKTQFKIFLF